MYNPKIQQTKLWVYHFFQPLARKKSGPIALRAHTEQISMGDLPCKLVLTKRQNLATDLCNNATAVLRASMLQYMLYYIVTILVM